MRFSTKADVVSFFLGRFTAGAAPKPKMAWPFPDSIQKEYKVGLRPSAARMDTSQVGHVLPAYVLAYGQLNFRRSVISN